jgi:hypothetical protein
VEPKAGNIHLLGLRGHFQQLQNSYALPDVIGANTPGAACQVQLFQSFLPEFADH